MKNVEERRKPMYFYFAEDYSLEFFANARYLALKIISENQKNEGGFPYCSLSQQELADIAKMSKVKMNKIINELMDHEYISLFQGKRGKYEITEKGAKALWTIQSGEKK